MKKFCLLLASLATSIWSLAQTPTTVTDSLEALAKIAAERSDSTTLSPWTHNGSAGLNVSQATFSNWSPGGDPSIALNASFTYVIDYLAKKNLWTNRLELAYGINNTSSNGTRKTNDKIYLSSNYGYLIAKKLYIGATATFNTQFSKGYDYSVSTTDYISNFMAPGYLSIGAGLTYTLKPWLTLIFSPATYRATFVYDRKLSDLGSFGVAPGKHLLNEFGLRIRAELNTTLWKKLSVYSRLELYSNYLHNPQNIDVSWDVQLSYALAGWLTANLLINMVYDDEVMFGATVNTPGSPKLQLKEVLGIGFQVNF